MKTTISTPKGIHTREETCEGGFVVGTVFNQLAFRIYWMAALTSLDYAGPGPAPEALSLAAGGYLR